MTGVGLTITGNGYDFNFTRIEDKPSFTQNVIVTLGTQAGTDIIYPNKGTKLNIFYIGKNYVSQTQAQHLANFAAAAAFNFYRQFNNETVRLSAIKIDASSLFFNSPNLKVNVIISENPDNFRN